MLIQLIHEQCAKLPIIVQYFISRVSSYQYFFMYLFPYPKTLNVVVFFSLIFQQTGISFWVKNFSPIRKV